MEQGKLLTYLNQPETLKGDNVQWVESLTERYPFFSIGQCLLAIAYQNEGDQRFDRQLKKAACAMPDRNRLRQSFILAKQRYNAPPADVPEPDTFFRFVDSSRIKETDQDALFPEKTFVIPEIKLSSTREDHHLG